ncbi:triose-phosphate isomerase [Leptospira gomenensis]|uniref:Triosephosphate isomerase n=1 Tax=Leptospira gomenensis TaxID=2484974 RepID=A0A5F1Y7G4_9LEPT|nr:triose-phosphate isomerase [Leptospira gomenensis]TGK30878.1 triose-phosphate isomerase [Leptospira gomenensis]TGK32516.1 triose-phosphate isomerase [Leptospira gomenensis]TGK45402.1 triose-phosphate isomerase [Leptospira gomenensis]TGK60606.1 triose-phosphate isomerase [Leptospira gomenensis]
MRKTVIAGNWKMNLSEKEAVSLAQSIKEKIPPKSKDRVALVFPSMIHLASVAKLLEGSGVLVGAQNCYPSGLAAFTGETSPEQLKEIGVGVVMIGHSERRQFLGESNSFCNEKVRFLLKEGFTALYCVGETLSERESGKTFAVIGAQIREGLQGIESNSFSKLILAYEPVWAIGTGKVATPAQAQEVHAFIRKEVAGLFLGAAEVAQSISILYGGSVKPDNIQALLKEADIDGGLVGGASQKIDSYAGLF